MMIGRDDLWLTDSGSDAVAHSPHGTLNEEGDKGVKEPGNHTAGNGLHWSNPQLWSKGMYFWSHGQWCQSDIDVPGVDRRRGFSSSAESQAAVAQR